MSLPHPHHPDDEHPRRPEPLRALPAMAAMVDDEGDGVVERQLRDLVERYRLLLDLSPDAIVVHEQGLLRYVNPAGVRFLEASEADDVVDRSMLEFVDPASVPSLLARIAELDLDGSISSPAELTIVGLHGRRMILESTSVRTRWLGRPAYQVILRDTSARREQAEAEARYLAAVDQLDVGMVVIAHDGTVRSHNAAASHLVPGLRVGGDSLIAVMSLGPTDADGRALRAREMPVARAFAGADDPGPIDVKVTLPGGVQRWIRADARQLVVDGDPLVVCSLADITAQRKAAEVLEHRARHDDLTGLPNRTYFLSKLTVALVDAAERGHRVGVVFVDLDRFKHVNDAHGHLIADEVMVRVARAITSVVGTCGTVGRLPGDEFVVLLPDADDVGARNVARSVAAAVGTTIVTSNGAAVRLTASVGVALADGHLDALEVLRDADVAMYQAKEHGRDQIRFFDDDLRAGVRRRLAIEEDLRDVLDEGRLLVHHQPVFSLASGEVTSTEALARWPGGGVTPSEFVPVAEEAGMIAALGSAVLRQACADAARWRLSHPAFRVAVNLSASQLADPRLPDLVAEVLTSSGLDADGLWLEVTESVLMDAEHGITALGRLRDLGVHLAIDDFGTGYSSLSYLKQLPVQAVKVDRSFVIGVGSDPQDDAIVASVISLAHALHLDVVAEGVETTVQLEALRRLGCDRVQGFLLARPAPAESLDLGLLVAGAPRP